MNAQVLHPEGSSWASEDYKCAADIREGPGQQFCVLSVLPVWKGVAIGKVFLPEGQRWVEC